MTTKAKGERKNSDSVPLTSYLVRPGTLLRIVEHGRSALICELVKPFSAITGTFAVHPLGWPHPITLHLAGIKNVRLPSTTGEAMTHAQFREVRRRQREAFEQERGTSAPMTDKTDNHDNDEQEKEIEPS